MSEKTLACPDGKEVCLILVRDMTQLLFSFLQEQKGGQKDYLLTNYNCSGCSGLIKFSIVDPEEETAHKEESGAVAPIEAAAKKVYGGIIATCFGGILSSEKIARCLGHFQEIQLEKGSILISQGKQNLNLYIISAGELAVEDNGLFIEILKESDLCGEMSYLGADIAVSTIRAIGTAKVLAIEGVRFSSLLGGVPEIQSFIAKLLAKRLLRTNAARVRDFEACMTGRVDEIVPAELFQIFHMHQKTGVLNLDLPGGSGHVSFRDGCIINAGYNDLSNEEAIFKILGEKSGIYRFTTGLSPQEMRAAEIGDFMMLLMEGVKRVDEDPER